MPKSDDEFNIVAVQDNFIYKGTVVKLPDETVYIGNHMLDLGDDVIFAKYSPDTHEVEENGEKLKFVRIEDLLEVFEYKDNGTE